LLRNFYTGNWWKRVDGRPWACRPPPIPACLKGLTAAQRDSHNFIFHLHYTLFLMNMLLTLFLVKTKTIWRHNSIKKFRGISSLAFSMLKSPSPTFLGMNLKNNLEEHPFAFYATTISLIVMSFAVIKFPV